MPSKKPLRFAALIRVSTEKQERKGESLRTQQTQIEQAVEAMGGKIAATYAGQEHGTTGYEREQLDKLLADAQKKRKPFDAVIVADATRWSRDNVRSETGLEVLRDSRVRFFVLQTEHDLYNTEARLFLALTATIGAYHARTQKHKSILNRIERAKRGIPTGGRVPFGRVFDKETERWSLDEEKVAVIRDVAERYLQGESLEDLAEEHGYTQSYLGRVLRNRCGSQWQVSFKAADLDIDETVSFKVPPLLPAKTIRAVHSMLTAKRSYLHCRAQSSYLLSGRVFCAKCGYTMSGQQKKRRKGVIRYYRHSQYAGGAQCPLRPRPHIRADVIEQEVLHKLFKMFGNTKAIEAAVKSAVPNHDKVSTQRDRVQEQLDKIGKARDRVLSLIEKDLITDEQAEEKLSELKQREATQQGKLDDLVARLARMPDIDTLKQYVEHLEDGAIIIYDDSGNFLPGGNSLEDYLAMGDEDRSHLIDTVFGAPLPDGKPAGVYITPAGGDEFGPKRFRFEVRGLLCGKVRGITPRTLPSPRTWPRSGRTGRPKRPGPRVRP